MAQNDISDHQQYIPNKRSNNHDIWYSGANLKFLKHFYFTTCNRHKRVKKWLKMIYIMSPSIHTQQKVCYTLGICTLSCQKNARLDRPSHRGSGCNVIVSILVDIVNESAHIMLFCDQVSCFYPLWCLQDNICPLSIYQDYLCFVSVCSSVLVCCVWYSYVENGLELMKKLCCGNLLISR